MTVMMLRRMVRWGPWVFHGVDDKGRDKTHWEDCHVPDCGKHIRYVHLCRLDDDDREWRIGSTCGPNLMNISQEEWTAASKAVLRDLKLLYRAQRLLPLENGATPWSAAIGQLGPGWVEEMIEVIERGQLDERCTLRKVQSMRGITDLQIVNRRLRSAENFHKLKPLTMGPAPR